MMMIWNACHFSKKKEEEESRASLHRGDQGLHHGMDDDAGRVPAQRARISSAAPGVIRPPPRARARVFHPAAAVVACGRVPVAAHSSTVVRPDG